MRIPKLCRAKARNLAFVCVGSKKKIYLGKWGSPEAAAKYSEYVDKLIRGEDLLAGEGETRVVTLADLASEFFAAKKDYYVKNGADTRQIQRFRAALEFPLRFFADLPVDDFGPLKLQAARREMIQSGRFSREYLNALVNCLRHVFKFGVEQELVKPETLAALRAVSPLKRGRVQLKESDPVRPVSLSDYEAALAHMSPVVADMTRLQRLTGMRPGEVCAMRAVDLDRRSDVWIYTLPTDKTDWRRAPDDKRRIPLGARAQRLLSPYLAEIEGTDRFVFSPARAAEARALRMRAERKAPITAQTLRRDQRQARRIFADGYTTDAYRRAIARACLAAGVPRWAPNQLRRLYATEIRAKYGLEAAQIMLGHSCADVTQIYAERDFVRMVEIAEKEG